MTQGPGCSTVTGRTSPLSSNSCVMPIFFPIMPLTAIIFSRLIMPAVRGHCRLLLLRRFRRLVEGLDLHIHAGREIELHERVHRLLRGLQDIDQALVRADLESLARFLVYVRRPQHAILVLHRGQRNGPRHLGAGAARRLHDLAGRLVEHAVIVGLQPDANSLSYHISSLKELAVRSPRLNCVSFDYCSFFMSGELPESCHSFHRSCSGCSPAALPFRRVLSCASTTRVQRSMSWSIYICLHTYAYAKTSLMVPAPTVRPPSRMAKRKPFSMATGVISSMVSATLSPGITISVAAGSSATPVTSVVRK